LPRWRFINLRCNPTTKSSGLRELFVPEVAGCEQPAEDDEVASVPTEARAACVAERRRLADQCADESGTTYGSFAASDSHRDGLAALQCLGPAGRREGRAAGDALAQAGALADPVRQEYVDRGVASDPAMLETLRRDAC
jgi:hypothetical protein